MNEWGVRETLRFDGAWFPVAVPWSAVFGVSSPANPLELRLDPDGMPEDVRALYDDALLREAQTIMDAARGMGPPRVRVPNFEVPAEARRPGEVRRGHLRLVRPADDGAGE